MEKVLNKFQNENLYIYTFRTLYKNTYLSNILLTYYILQSHSFLLFLLGDHYILSQVFIHVCFLLYLFSSLWFCKYTKIIIIDINKITVNFTRNHYITNAYIVVYLSVPKAIYFFNADDIIIKVKN